MDVIKTDENNNQIIGTNPNLQNTQIIFRGRNNRLICEDNVNLHNSILDFKADNSIIYLSSNRNAYYLNVSIYNNSLFYMGENSYMNGRLNFSISEQKNIFIGKECLFALDIWMRIADPHLIYDTNSLKRINLSKSIYLGDHVWVGQDALILKGTQIGSGSIIGAKALVAGKKIQSNSIWGGVPARLIRDDVLFDGSSVHYYKDEQTENSKEYDAGQWIYKNEGEVLSFDEIEENFNSINNVDEKVAYLQSVIRCDDYNRFYMGVKNKHSFFNKKKF